MPKIGTVQIILNGKPTKVKPGLTVSDLLTQWRMRPELVTVELNDIILQKLDYETTRVREGNRIEFIFYIGGSSPMDPTSALGRLLRINSRGRLNDAFSVVSRALIYIGGGDLNS